MRYSRIEKLKQIPSGFIDTIKDKNLVLVGCGGVGSVLAELLVRSGFLNLVLIDNDLIDETNLSRQNFFESQLGESKSSALAENLNKINSKVKLVVHSTILDSSNIEKTCDSSDLIIDCSDNFATRFMLNRVCFATKVPLVSGAAIRWEGQLTSFTMQTNTPCYRCLFYIKHLPLLW